MNANEKLEQPKCNSCDARTNKKEVSYFQALFQNIAYIQHFSVKEKS